MGKMKRPNEEFVEHLCWFWVSGIVVTLLVLVLAGCASRARMNTLFYDLGVASGKIQAMNGK